ncbi:Butyryl-CoA dehydrogenase [Carbonactinospora thermoautotrophica]|uniref:Butyryl-CoA dehydrogenase n=1 Tax=Carbonactinospora thermoautotrophica TaxID=1469144 RepID=A0A132MZ19_9ACTN|nr:acyl-CoA dehydrogenase family protein [Carbonactinospora thermoautotrophica]KWX03129.1 Butyryl-CoA dehydrogenase [Carbonactinospora thermoautotrophica]
MDYFCGPDHLALREEVREFAEREVRPLVPVMEARQTVELELSRKIARQGWIGATIPRRYGGMGLGHLAKTIIIEELSRVSGAMGAMVQASQLGVAKVIHYGTERQKQQWLPLFASGEVMPTIAVTEPESGGHVLAMRSTAVRDGDSYILNGRKWFVGNSHIGDVHGVVVRTGEGSRGLTAFLVESDRPGFRLGSRGSQAGLYGFSYGELIFEDCRVPIENRIGEEGQGLDVAYSSSTLYGRPNLAAVALGIHQAILEDTVRFCEERVLYGKPLRDLPSVNLKVGEMNSRLLTARITLYHASHLLDSGAACDAELMNAKLVNCEYALTSARAALEIFAARGCQKEYNIERYLRDVIHAFPAAGTSDVQRLRLAQAAFGQYAGEWSARLRDLVRADVDAWCCDLGVVGPLPEQVSENSR